MQHARPLKRRDQCPFRSQYDDESGTIENCNYNNTTRIKISEIPEFLQSGSFYEALNKDEYDDIIEVPSDLFITSEEVPETIKEFVKLLRVTEFWDLRKIPAAAIEFCHTHSLDTWDLIADKLLTVRRYETLVILTQRGHVSEVIRLEGFYDIFPEWLKLYKPESSFGEMAVGLAAKVNALEYVRVLRENHYPYGRYALAEAANSGSFACLSYLYENSCQCEKHLNIEHDTDCAMYNAPDQRCSCLPYYYDENWSTSICFYAARAGSVKCLSYAHTHGWPSDSDVLLAAMEGNHVDCLVYALKNECAVDDKIGCPFQPLFTMTERDKRKFPMCTSDQNLLRCLDYAVIHGWLGDTWLAKHIRRNKMTLCLEYVEFYCNIV